MANITSFTINVPDADLDDPRNRLRRTRLLMGVLPAAPPQETRRSIELFAREVMPPLKRDADGVKQ